jgi:hypothetical protein
MSKEKATLLETTYDACIEWDLEALGIDTNEIADYFIKWGELNITLKNGDCKTYDSDFDVSSIDWKRPTTATFYDKNYDEVELLKEKAND